MPNALLRSLDPLAAASVRGLLTLVDNYAETRHKFGAPEYNAQAAEARKQLIAGLAAELGNAGPAPSLLPSLPAASLRGRTTPPSPRGFSCD